jgi:light-harvesting complex II chlorophyll a/b binding protein 4
MATKVVKKGAKAPAVERTLWFPQAEAPAWLDGSLPGDVGFDPLGLSKPVEYVQMGLDEFDDNAAVNKAGEAVGKVIIDANKPTATKFQPYTEAFDLLRFRECELIHGRWCMLATLGAIVAELSTGVTWIDAGKVELEQAQYLGLNLPFDLTSLVIIEVLLMGYIEFARSSELDQEARLYPGGAFDPLGLSKPDQTFALRTAEIKHGRLAMVAVFGFATQAGFTGSTSLLENLALLN